MRMPTNFTLVVAALSLVPPATSCNKNASSEEEAKTSTTTSPESPESSKTGAPTTGTLALETGDVELRVSGVSSATSFAATNAAMNTSAGQPGTLTIGVGLAQTPGSASLTTTTWPTFRPDSITSGAPDGFKVTIAKIALRSDSGPDSILLNSAEGVTIALDSGTMDLSQLIAAGKTGSDGASAKFSVPVGTYRSIKITYLRGAEVKGCVSGDFNSTIRGRFSLRDGYRIPC